MPRCRSERSLSANESTKQIEPFPIHPNHALFTSFNLSWFVQVRLGTVNGRYTLVSHINEVILNNYRFSIICKLAHKLTVTA